MTSVAEIRRRAMGAGLRPPPRLSLSQWADEHFRLSAESSAAPGKWTCLPYQRSIMDSITDPTVTSVSLMKSARIGYALALDTPIPTPVGWVTMGGVAVGDLVFDAIGKPCRVIYKSPIYTDHECYRVCFCDGSEVVADAGHRWFVESDVSIEHLVAGLSGRTGRPKPGEARSYSGVLDTRALAVAIRTSRGRNALTVPVAGALECQNADLPVPPYTLGLWLGDGNTSNAAVTQHRPDADETAGYVAREGIPVRVVYRDKRYPNNATLVLGGGWSRSECSALVRSFWRIGLLKRRRKHIPATYLWAARSQRLELLRGLMDSDGTITRDGRAEFTNTNEGLARGVYDLVVSLGMKASFRHRLPQRANCLDQWRVNFKPTPQMNPFRLARKAARVQPAARPSITFRRRIVSVDRVESTPVQCIEVDSPGHLFLCGRGMIPTHNTLMISAAVGYYIHQAPAAILLVQPTVDDAKNFSKETIAPMLRDVPVLSAIVFEDSDDSGPRDSGNTILHKRFPGGVLSMVGANSGAGFRRVSRKVVAFDEVDAYPSSAGSDGDPIMLGTKRAEYFWDRKIIAGSTPLVAGHSRIEALYEAGDRRRYYVPCPECGHMDFMIFTEREGGGHFIKWPEGKPEEAYLVCSGNGCVIDHKHKRDMVAAGEWRATGEFKGHASFHINALYSYSPNSSWGDIAKEFLAAKGNSETLRVFCNTILAETWKERGEAPEWERLYARRETYQIGSIPEGVKFLTAGVDVQKDRFVYEVVGWGAGKESWSIEIGVLPADTSSEKDWATLDELLNRTWGQHSIRMLAVDSGYNTQMVYAWARRYPMSRVIATKGNKTARTTISAPAPVDVTIRGVKHARGYKVWTVGTDVAKAELYGWLKMPAVGGGYCHFPEYGEDFFKQLTGEHLVSTVDRRGFKQHEWQLIPGRENHWLDARVYARAAAALLGLDRYVASQSAPGVAAAPPAPAQPRPDTRFPNGSGRAKGWLGRGR